MINRVVFVCCLLVIAAMSCSKKSGTRSGGISPNVTVISNVEYGVNTTWQGGSEVLKLDLYTPKNGNAQNKLPLLVMVHGGSFLTGTKENIADLCSALAEKGLVVASIDYRLGWDYAGSSDCAGDTTSLIDAAYRAMQDLNASLRFLTANAAKYYIDTNWVFTGGASAGAVAALNGAYLTDAVAKVRFSSAFSKLGSLHKSGNNLTNNYTIQGICSMWGGVFDPGIITAGNAIPTIFYHGSDDLTIPVASGTYMQCPNYQTLYGSGYLYNKLSNLGVPSVVHIYAGGGHGPSEYAGNAGFVASTTFCFFESLRNKQAETGAFRDMESSCK